MKKQKVLRKILRNYIPQSGSVSLFSVEAMTKNTNYCKMNKI